MTKSALIGIRGSSWGGAAPTFRTAFDTRDARAPTSRTMSRDGGNVPDFCDSSTSFDSFATSLRIADHACRSSISWRAAAAP